MTSQPYNLKFSILQDSKSKVDAWKKYGEKLKRINAFYLTGITSARNRQAQNLETNLHSRSSYDKFYHASKLKFPYVTALVIVINLVMFFTIEMQIFYLFFWNDDDLDFEVANQICR